MEYAWIHLTRLCGCNMKVPVERRGKSIYVEDNGKRYRLSAKKWDEGKPQFRGSLCIEPWSSKADRVTHEERGWLD